jgi:signal transduction histidine kinase
LPADAAPAPEPGAALLRLVREALDLAAEPVLDPARARRLLGRLLPAVAREIADGGAGALRSGLVTAASTLLAEEPGVRLATIRSLGSRAARLDWLAARCLPEPAEAEVRALERLAEGDEPAPLEGPGARLAMEARSYADAPVESLLDAHRVIRLFAVVRRLEQEPGSGPAAAQRLLGLGEDELAALPEPEIASSGDAVEPDTRAMLQSWCDLHVASARAVAGLPALAGAPEVRALAERLLAGPVALARVEGEDGLALCGLEDLEGQLLVRDGRRSLAAAALAEGLPAEHATIAEAPVIDRQIASRLGGEGLRAVPMYGPDPLGVLLAPTTTDPHRLAVVAVHLAPALTPGVLLTGRLEEQGRRLRTRQERRVREVIHEVNNPLSVVRNYLHVLGSRLEGSHIDGESPREQLRRIGDEIRRAGEILRTLLDTPESAQGEGAAGDPGRVSLNELVADVTALLEPALLEDAEVRLELDLDRAAPELTLDAGRLRQVLLNLLKNAVEAMPEGGEVRVVTRTGVATAAGSGVEIRVSDTGPGIPPEQLPELFVPGRSTKGRSRGLGLHIVGRLVEELGGSISAESRPDSGTRFRILLPD